MSALISDRVLECIRDLTKEGDAPEGVGRLTLAGLIAWREEVTDQSDIDWLDRVITESSEEVSEGIALQIGAEATDTPLQGAVQAFIDRSDTPLSRAMHRGTQEYLLRSISLQGEKARRDPGEHSSAREIIQTCSQDICHEILSGILGGLKRQALLKKLNIVILIEEARMDLSGFQAKSQERRKLSLDYAITRLLATMPSLEGATLEDFEEVFRAVGNMSRLNNAVSDSLDRVQSYASKAAKDEDISEAGIAAGRPQVQSHGDIRAAARQCRKFRDREKV